MSWKLESPNFGMQPQPQQAQQNQPDFDLDAQLAMFTNDQFFDYDMGVDPLLHMSSEQDFTGNYGIPSQIPNMNHDQSFGFAGHRTPPDFASQPYAGQPKNVDPILAPSTTRRANISQSPSAPSNTKSRSPSSAATTKPANVASSNSVSPAADNKDLPQEEDARLAAEEDKRRRNTAASARFRVKKKQREQATERKAKDLENKVDQLEGRVKELEKENDLLKGLLTEKERSGVSAAVAS